MKRHALLAAWSGLGILLVAGAALAQDLTVGNYVLAGTKRITRTVYEYTYRADISNGGAPVLNVMATVTSSSPHTTVVDPGLSFSDVPAGATVGSSDTFAIRQDRLYAFGWSDLAWDIQYQTAPSDTLAVGPQGGVLQFPNGVTLEVPPGAVTETVNLTITDLACADLDPAIWSPVLATKQTRCLRGFAARPDGLVFNAPVTAVVPVALEPGEIPVRMEVSADRQQGWITEGEIVYHGGQGAAVIRLQHFSDEWLAALLNFQEQACKQCDTYMSDLCESELREPNPNFANLQPGACWLLEEERAECGVAEVECCMEGSMDIKVTDVDFSTGKCQIVGGKVQVTYPDCAGKPTFDYDEAETIDCPEGMSFALEVVADPPWIYRCEQARLAAELTGTKDGEVFFESAAFPAQWEVITGQGSVVADYVPVGPNTVEIEGLGKGTAVLHASAIGAEDDILADYSLRVEDLSLEINPGEGFTLSVGENRSLSTLCIDCPANIAWSIDASTGNPDAVRLTPLPDDAVLVDALGRGTARIIAQTLDHCGEPIEDAVSVRVIATQVSVSPGEATIAVNGAVQVDAIVTDGEGCTLNWYSNDTGIATVTASGLVTGVAPGTANITAACGEDFAVAKIHVVVQGFLLTWSGSYEASDTAACSWLNQNSWWDTSKFWSWSGSARFEGHKTVQSLSTSGHRQYASSVEWQELVGAQICAGDSTSTTNTVMTEPGVARLKEYLEDRGIYITQTYDGPRILEPLLNGLLCSPTLFGDWSGQTIVHDTCPPLDYADPSQGSDTMSFCFDNPAVGAPLRPDDETRHSFSKTVIRELTYPSQTGCPHEQTPLSGEYKLREVWQVNVTKVP